MKHKHRKSNAARPTTVPAAKPAKEPKSRARQQMSATRAETKTAILIKLLSADSGDTVARLCEATGWQAHSIHGFMAGTLKKKGLKVTSDGKGAERRYRILSSGRRS